MFLQKAFLKLPWEKFVSPDVNEKLSFVCELLSFSSLHYSGLLILSSLYYNTTVVWGSVSQMLVCVKITGWEWHTKHTHTKQITGWEG